MEKTDNRIAETVLWAIFSVPVSIVVVVVSVCVGAVHAGRYFLETAKEYVDWLLEIWT